MTQNLSSVEAGENIAAAAGQQPPAAGTAGAIAAAVRAGTIAAGTQAGQAQAIQTAVAAVRDTMETIEGLKEAEGLSDTVVDAIGILENAWAELGEVQLGNTAVSDIDENAIEDVTQEQVDILESKIDYSKIINANTLGDASVREARDAIAEQFVGADGDGENSLTAQLATLTQNLTRVEAGGTIEAGAEETPEVGTVYRTNMKMIKILIKSINK